MTVILSNKLVNFHTYRPFIYLISAVPVQDIYILSMQIVTITVSKTNAFG